MNRASSREKHPKPDAVLAVPYRLGLPEKFPIPKTRTSLNLITIPDLLHDDNSIFRLHPKRERISISPQPTPDTQGRISSPSGQTCSGFTGCTWSAFPLGASPEGPVQLSWSCGTGRSHRSSHSITPRVFPELNFEDNKNLPAWQ